MIHKAMNNRFNTAVHEAGHAVIGRVLGMVCGGATTVADDDSAGHSITADPCVVQYQWEQCGRYRETRSAFRGRIMTFMAGREAELELLGHYQGGDNDDQSQIALMAEEAEVPGWAGWQDEENEAAWDRFEDRLRRATRHLVRRHRSAIERVADGLMQHETLTANDIDQISGIPKRASLPFEEQASSATVVNLRDYLRQPPITK